MLCGRIAPTLQHHIRTNLPKRLLTRRRASYGLKMALFSIFLLLMLGKLITCVPQDLSGKMLTFPQETNTAHVKITTANLQLGAATVCLRFFTDISREYSLFSLATPSQPDNFHIIANRFTVGDIQFAVGGNYVYFHGQNVKVNDWQSVCGTWNANTGLTQLWLNGYPGSRKFATASNLNGGFTIVLGQEQDSVGGGFDAKQSFVGMMSDLHMWDHVLPQDQIQAFGYKGTFPKGNILNWASLEFQVTGNILIEDEQKL